MAFMSVHCYAAARAKERAAAAAAAAEAAGTDFDAELAALVAAELVAAPAATVTSGKGTA
jgi:hypothetical protein